ncbi:hypothetical protein P7K49_014230 [Saguinus oedipus]|uniref:Uncharacterized protein n=1 Tax=Saguinus oedipus TaxID=9490 RepID=A0ABQ9VJ07_SAGOE|nr:hypothetical protein P7K49_014230 [Saguinus oedipus]
MEPSAWKEPIPRVEPQRASPGRSVPFTAPPAFIPVEEEGMAFVIFFHQRRYIYSMNQT